MTYLRTLLVVLLTGFLVTAASAQTAQGRRVALVIGNSAYAAQGTLANPGPDSRLVADALRRVGFTVVTQNDVGKQAMERALRDFSRQADGAEVALVYYAGHGLEANGVNWLLPVDAQLADERDLSFEAISLDTVLGTVERARGLRMVVLDACRNNPFARSMRRSAATRATVTRGLADVEVTGTLVLYAARGGTVAQDGPVGGNSPFAAAFARRIPEPDVDIRLLVSKVRDDVLSATGRLQEPFHYGSLPGIQLPLVRTTSAELNLPTDRRQTELAYWNSCCSSSSAGVADYEAYLNKVTSREFSGTYADIARRRVNSLRNPTQRTPNTTPSTQGSTRLRECIRRMGQNIASAPCPQIDNDEQVRIETAYKNALANDAPVGLNWSGSFKINFLIGITRRYVLVVQRPQMTPGAPNCRNINATLDIDGQGPQILPTETYCKDGDGWVPVA